MASQPTILTVQEAATQLRVEPQQVRELIKSGKLRAFSVGARSRKFWRIDQSAIEEYKANSQAIPPKLSLEPIVSLPLRTKKRLSAG